MTHLQSILSQWKVILLNEGIIILIFQINLRKLEAIQFSLLFFLTSATFDQVGFYSSGKKWKLQPITNLKGNAPCVQEKLIVVHAVQIMDVYKINTFL